MFFFKLTTDQVVVFHWIVGSSPISFLSKVLKQQDFVSRISAIGVDDIIISAMESFLCSYIHKAYLVTSMTVFSMRVFHKLSRTSKNCGASLLALAKYNIMGSLVRYVSRYSS